DMNGPAFAHHATQYRPSSTRDRMIAQVLLELGRQAIARDAWIGFVLSPVDRCAVCITQSRSRFDQSIQYRLKVESGAADDLENVSGGGLLLQGFAQLVKQSRVLDSDDRLIGKVRDQLDLLVGERPHFLAE